MTAADRTTSEADDALARRMAAAVAFADMAREVTLSYFSRRGTPVEQKRDGTPVTAADRGAEELLRREILREFPSDGVLGEEFGETDGTSGFRWVLDPVDGTKSFICGVPLWGTLIGLEERGRSVGGVIDIPGLDERVWGARGLGAHHSAAGRVARASVSGVASLADAVLVTTATRTFENAGRWQTYRDLQKAAKITRGWSDAYGFLLVATGRADAMVEPVVAIWHVAAVAPVIEAAGGQFTDWHGEATTTGGEGIATNGRLHEQVLAITRRAARNLPGAGE